MTEADRINPLPAPGTVLADRYRLDARIGRGGMAEVFRGHDELLDRTVAVKVFRFDTLDDSEQRRIEAEMRTLAALRHSGLVTLYDASAGDDESGNAPFLVMEYIGGPTLAQRLAAGPLGPTETATLGAELAAALEHVHASGVVHRDIKPANILLDDNHGAVTAKLTDFGVARLTEGTRLTADGMTIGTPNYLSPEQARGAQVGPPSDIYTLGLVLIECLTGAVAFPGSGLEAAVARLSRAPQIPQQFGPQWAGLLAAMTAPDPRARPDAAAVGASLTALHSDALTAPLTAQHTVPLGEPAALAGTAVLAPHRNRWPLLLGALVLVAALAAALAIALDSGSTDTPTGGVRTTHGPSSPAKTTPIVRRTVTISPSTPPPAPEHNPPGQHDHGHGEGPGPNHGQGNGHGHGDGQGQGNGPGDGGGEGD
jgi:eukaryotic-like serine/threonine-protein kinase